MSTEKRIYKIQLNEMELNKLNLVENETIRQSTMSIFAYLLKLNAMENDKLDNANCSHLKTKDNLKISFRKFLDKYNRGHQDKKISIRTFKNRVDLLEKLGLIIRTKFKDTFIYSFVRYLQVNSKVNSKVNSFNKHQTIDKPKKIASFQKHKYLNLKYYLDIDSCNNSSKKVSFVDKLKTNFKTNVKSKKSNLELCEEKHYIFNNKTNYNNEKSNNSIYTVNKFQSDGLEVCSTWSDIEKLVEDAFKEFKIVSFTLKNDIIKKLSKNLKNITKKFAGNYIRKTVLQAKAVGERRRAAYARAITIAYDSRKHDGWTNYGCEHGVDYYLDAVAKLTAR